MAVGKLPASRVGLIVLLSEVLRIVSCSALLSMVCFHCLRLPPAQNHATTLGKGIQKVSYAQRLLPYL